MQERYLGDVHDYVKWALLIHLHEELRERLGVNWYKTHSEHVDRPGNLDGNNRKYRNSPEWRSWSRELFDKLSPFQCPSYRSLVNFKRDEVLPKDTLFFPAELRAGNDRDEWHSRAIANLSDAGIIFLDPDNGFEVRSGKGRKRPKYATFAETCGYFKRGKIVVGIQFAGMCNPTIRAGEVHSRLMSKADCASTLSIVRARVTPNILFISLCDSLKAGRLESALKSFVERSHCLPTINGGQRIELIP
jgi:hypothetical protein